MKITMKAGLSGPRMSLAPGETKEFENDKEAQRLIDAGFAELAKEEAAPRVIETLAERIARLTAELATAEDEMEAEAAAAEAAAAAKAATATAKTAKTTARA